MTQLKPSLTRAQKRLNEPHYYDYTINPDVIGLGRGKTYLIKTYGCQANLSDSEKMRGLLASVGYTEVDEEQEADVIILNTCAVRNNAEQRVFGELGRIKNLKVHNPDLIIVLAGCMSQEESTIDQIKRSYPYVDLVIGTHNVHDLLERLAKLESGDETALAVYSYEGDVIEGVPQIRDHQYKAWVQIMYGCDEFCTYCIVPYTRGRERSRKPQAIIDEVKQLVSEGYLEVTLLGQNVNAYGNDLETGYRFANLLSDLAQTGINRIRFVTSHPRDLDDETINVMAQYSNIMPAIHLPVQSGSDAILKKMNRKYTSREYLTLIEKLKRAVPGIAITTDIIVGFPGETEEDFQATLDLVAASNFEGAFTFVYSPRDGTPAARYEDPISMSEKKSRLQRLNTVINQGYKRGNERFVNQVVHVLVDGVSAKRSDVLTGYSEHNKLVNFKGDESLIGSIIPVKITKAYTWHLAGERIS